MTKKHLFQNGLALLMCLFLFAGMSFAQTKTATITISNPGERTWMVPNEIEGETVTGVTSLTFEAWGGGGAGGYAYSTGILKSAGGGGGAAYAKSATLTDVNVGDRFSLTIGAPGIARGDDASHYTVQNGGTTYVYAAGENLLAKAVGGKSVTGTQNLNGAAGGNKNDCYGSTTASGGNGGNAYGGLGSQTLGIRSGAWCISGSGGGAGGPGGNGGDAANSWFNGNLLEYLIDLISGQDAHALQITGQPGAGNGNGAGSGALGIESQIFGGGGWGNAQGNAGGNYGGGGSGAIGNGLSWGDANGGQGGNGAVRITIEYTTAPAESVEIADASINSCSGADFDVALNITAEGFNVNQAVVTYLYGTYPSTLSINNFSLAYNSLDGKWHITGKATNTTTSTTVLPVNVTVKTPSGNATATAQIKINVYGKLDGGIIAADQFVCQDQTIQMLMGNGTEVYSNSLTMTVTTAPATGGSHDGYYQWWIQTPGSDDFTAITEGGSGANYTPTATGINFYQRTYTDNVCETTLYASDGWSADYLYVVTVNPFNPGNLGGSDNICTNEDFNKTLEITNFTSAASSSEYVYWKVYWQKSTDGGVNWTNVTTSSFLSYSQALASTYTINVHAGDLDAGEIQYRYALQAHKESEGITCTMVPCNGVYKLIVGTGDATDYTSQFKDVTITLWYGACDTNIANLAKPVLDPAPISITRGADGYTKVGPGEYNITWLVSAGSCGATEEYTQKVIVKFPPCGTLDEPYVITDRNGNEYNTIRIGCECWLAENLRSDADNATYYDEDDSNEDFGKLYDWNDAIGSFNYELETKLGTTYIQGICPMGWAVPTVDQFDAMMEIAGNAEDIKSDDENAWLPDLVGTNTVGFAAMGAGFYSGMQYQRMLGYTDFWTADVNESNSTMAKAMELRPGCDELLVVDKNKADKLSVRCMRVEPLSYININIAFDMNDEWGDGWNGAYLLAEYGACSVKMIAIDSHNECTIPVPQGSDVTLSWHSGMYDYEASFTVTNEETGEVIYQVETDDLTDNEDVELTTFHINGACNPEDLQLVNFVLKAMFADGWNGGKLQVDYGTGAMNLTMPRQAGVYQDTYTVALPVGAHILLNWIPGSVDSENSFEVKYSDGTVIFNAPTVSEGTMYEFDVEKH